MAAFATVALFVVGVRTGPAVAGHLMHPRDIDEFQAYVGRLADTDMMGNVSPEIAVDRERDAAWVTAHADLVLAAGDRACDWLKAQPKAPKVDPTGRFGVDALWKAYLGVDFAARAEGDVAYDDPGSGDIGLPISPEARLHVVAGSWEYLCWSTRESRTAPETLEDD